MVKESEDEHKLKRFHVQNKRKRAVCAGSARTLCIWSLKLQSMCQVDTCGRICVQIRIASRGTGACKNEKNNKNSLVDFTVKQVLEQQTAWKTTKNEVLLDGYNALLDNT